MPGPGGLIITSTDTEALAEFDKMLRMMMDPTAMGSAEPTFFYLKYRKAAAAKELLESILSGTSSGGGGGGGGGLIGDMVSEVGGGLIGSLLGGGGSSVSASGSSLTTGDVIVNADPQLNILVIRANAVDLELCEQLLKIIDQPDSIISVRTRGEFAVIPVATQDADVVASEIKAIFPDRIEGGGAAGGGGGGGNRAPDPREFLAALTGGGGRRGGAGGSSQLAEIKIAISVDKKTNSLLVMAPPQDIELIRQIVGELDEAGGEVEEGVEVVSLSGTNLNVGMIDSALKSMLGPKARTNNNASSSTSNTASAPSGGGGGDDGARQRAEMFQQLRERFGGGTGGAPGGRTGGTTSPFGGGGFPGFGRGGGTSPFGGVRRAVELVAVNRADVEDDKAW